MNILKIQHPDDGNHIQSLLKSGLGQVSESQDGDEWRTAAGAAPPSAVDRYVQGTLHSTLDPGHHLWPLGPCSSL